MERSAALSIVVTDRLCQDFASICFALVYPVFVYFNKLLNWVTPADNGCNLSQRSLHNS